MCVDVHMRDVHMYVDSLWFSSYKIIPSANRDNCNSSILVSMTFIYLSCIIALTSTSSTSLKRAIIMGILPLFLILNKISQLFTTEHEVNCETVWYSLYYIVIDSFHTFGKNFIMKGCWFQMHQFCIHWDDLVIFILSSTNVVYHIVWFACIEPSLHPRDDTWSLNF